MRYGHVNVVKLLTEFGAGEQVKYFIIFTSSGNSRFGSTHRVKKVFPDFGKVAEIRNLTFPIRFHKVDTTCNAKEKDYRLRTHFRSNSVRLNIPEALHRVSEDGLARKLTMLWCL